HAVIVLRVLEVILVLHPVAARLGVARELCVLFVDLRGRAPDLHIRTIALERSVAVIVVVTTTATTTAAGLTPAPPLTLHETFLIFRVLAPIGRELGRLPC